MATSEALTKYAENKIRLEVEKFVTKPVEVLVTFAVDRHMHTAHCSMNGGDGFQFQVEHTCADMYGSVDHLVDKLEAQLRKHKEKLKTHKGRHSSRDLRVVTSRDTESGEIDAEDILKYESARRRAGNGR
jgi:putative sigma-54 modulation protein